MARLPRLYRIVRILRLLKLFRFTKKNKGMRFLQDLLGASSAVSNMLGLAVMVLFLTHLVACMWFLQAKWQDFPDDSWVVQEDMLDKDVSEQYTVAVYWAL